MAGTTAKGKVAKEVEAKVSEAKCLICGNAANGNRGLCTAHHQQFYRALNELPRRERPAFEEEQIKEGRILAAFQISSIKKPNPFKSDRRDAS